MAELTCPPLGTGSVDFNVLHDAAKKAKTQEELVVALDKATTVVAPLPEVAETAPAARAAD